MTNVPLEWCLFKGENVFFTLGRASTRWAPDPDISRVLTIPISRGKPSYPFIGVMTPFFSQTWRMGSQDLDTWLVPPDLYTSHEVRPFGKGS